MFYKFQLYLNSKYHEETLKKSFNSQDCFQIFLEFLSFSFCLNSNLLMHNKNLNYVYEEFRRFAMIVHDVRIILCEMRAEILFGSTSRAMQGSFSLKFSKLIFFFGFNAQNVHDSFVRCSCQNLRRKPPGRRRKAKERRVTLVAGEGGRGEGALAPDTLIRPSAAWHVTMGFPAEIFPWK